MSELDEARVRLERAAEELAATFLRVVALRGDGERHAIALVEQFQPVWEAWTLAGIEVAMLEAERDGA